LVGASQRNYFENATASSKRTLKTTVATQLYTHRTPLSELDLSYKQYEGIVNETCEI